MSATIGEKVKAAQVVLGGFFNCKSDRDASSLLDTVFDLLADAREVFKHKYSAPSVADAKFQSAMDFLYFARLYLVEDKNGEIEESYLLEGYTNYCNELDLPLNLLKTSEMRGLFKKKYGASFSVKKGVYKGIRLKTKEEEQDVSGNLITTLQ